MSALLEGVDEGLALFHRYTAMQDETGPPEDAGQEVVQSRGDFPELREHEHFFTFLQDRLAEFSEALEFTAVLFLESFRTQELVGMIAELLAFHQRRKNQAATLDAFAVVQEVFELVQQISVENDLFFAQRREGLHFDFVRQIADDAGVGFQASEDVRANHLAQTAIACRIVVQMFWQSF